MRLLMATSSLFLQNNYEKENHNLKKYGCNFLTLCWIASNLFIPTINLKTKKDVLDFIQLMQSKGYLDTDFFVQKPLEILNALTGKKFKQLTCPPAFGIGGAIEWMPIYYPVPKQAIEIACYRHKNNFKNTHFSLVKRTEGDTFSFKNIFNTLGSLWIEEQAGAWFISDKRVYIEVK